MKLNSKTIVPSALLTAILALLTATFPGTATAATTVITGGTETNTTGFYSGGATYGFDFTSTIAQQINALGFWDAGAKGLGTSSYTVGLWNSSGTLLDSVTISNADALDTSVTVNGGQWRYKTLGTTVNLTNGASYTMGFYNTTTLSPFESLILDSSVTTASTVSIINQVRVLGGSGLAFPTNIQPSNNAYIAQVNAKFVPEPGSAGLMILGSLMLLGRRRKTKD